MAKKFTSDDFDNLNNFEKQIFADDFDGKIFIASSLPSASETDKTIRAELIRHLLLGELYRDENLIELPPAGLWVFGAHIIGNLDLGYCNHLPPLQFLYCRFENELSLMHAEVKLLNLNYSALDGTGDSFSGDSAKIKGTVFMEGLKAKGEVRLHGAEIGGTLEMNGAELNGVPHSFSCEGAKIKGDVLMKGLKAKGDVSWLGAEIGGQLDFENAKFDGDVVLQSTRVSDKFFADFARFGGMLNFDGTELADIVDDEESWPGNKKLILTGAKYTGFSTGSPNNAASRLKWLKKLEEFHPQPYRQLAKVFRENGQERDANEVLYEMEKRIGSGEWQDAYLNSDARRLWGQKQIPIVESFRYFIMLMFRVMTGFGYRLHYAMIWLVLAIGIGAIVAQKAFDNGQMVPNSDVILSSAHWIVIDDPHEWIDNTIEGKDWESFNSLAYAMDVYLPLVDFGQENTWAPSKDRGFWGWIVWWGRWVWKGAGWLLFSALIVSLSAMVERRYEK